MTHAKQEKTDDTYENWLLIKHEDAADAPEAMWSGSSDTDDKKQKPAAKKAQRRNAPALPDPVMPALATRVEEVPNGADWLFEVKFDGYRALIAASGDSGRITTRNGKDWTNRFGPIVAALKRLNLDGVLIDGEIVARDENGVSDFSRLQRAMKGDTRDLAFFAFDILAAGGEPLEDKPLSERKEKLRALLGETGQTGPIYYTDHVTGDGQNVHDEVCARGYEGIVAKRADRPYRRGRSQDWLKIKCTRDQEFVVVGWLPSDKARPFASLLLGTHDRGKLNYAGRVGTGFSEDEMAEIAKRLERIGRKTPPAENKIPSPIRRDAQWVRPELVVQIGFAEFTSDGHVRHARFLGLREDKPAKSVAREGAAPHDEDDNMSEDASVAGVELSHPDRILFPEQGVTKLELARYLDAIAEPLLAHAGDRLMSFVRCPRGREQKCFFQRHGGGGLAEGFDSLPVEQKDGGTEDYLYVKYRPGLVTAAQMGVLEFHIWGARIDDIARPDRLVFDLDPSEALDFDEVKQAAKDISDELMALGLESFPLLTGGKGIHVVAPLVRNHDWPVIKAFASAFAKRMADQDPHRFVAVASKEQRKGRIFIDYLRNDRGSTAIAPFSPRARKGAPLAWPVDWGDLDAIESADQFKLGAADPATAKAWSGYAKSRQTLKKTTLSALGVKTG